MWTERLFPPQASTAAGRVDLLTVSMLALSAVVCLGVFACIAWFCWKYRRGSEADRRPEVGHWFSTLMELTWTLIPLLIFIGLFIWSGVLYYWMEAAPPDARIVYVVGKQWMWKIQHVTGKAEIDELHVPRGVPIRLVMTSQDVIHDFFIPAFRIKHDVLPGRYTTEWFEATRNGTYQIFCSQYCGFEHARMIGRVIVMEPAAFDAWVAAPDLPVIQGLSLESFSHRSSPLATRGADLYQRMQCISCHGNPTVAPPLDHLYGHEVQLSDGSRTTADEAYLYESIVAPRARVVAGYTPMMPSYAGQLDAEDINALVEFIKSMAQP